MILYRYFWSLPPVAQGYVHVTPIQAQWIAANKEEMDERMEHLLYLGYLITGLEMADDEVLNA